MKTTFVGIATGVFVAIGSLGAAQHDHTEKSQYAGEQIRTIKMLSEDQIDGYLSGDGMGLALAVELNHYPGPKHVIDLANDLDLSTKQQEAADGLFQDMHADAVALGKTIVDLEKQLDSLCAYNQINEKTLADLTERIGVLQGKLRFTHMRAHLRMRKVLSDEQVAAYDQLRGYRD
jgi:Spy/CpxP family protein refolding chaperone